MKLRSLTIILATVALLPLSHAQKLGLPSATPTQVLQPWTAGTCPSGDTCATDLQRCVGTAATCTSSLGTWGDLTPVTQLTTASGTFTDTSVSPGTTYCYAAIAFWVSSTAPSGTTPSNAAPSAVDCATVPLAGGAAALGTPSATS